MLTVGEGREKGRKRASNVPNRSLMWTFGERYLTAQTLLSRAAFTSVNLLDQPLIAADHAVERPPAFDDRAAELPHHGRFVGVRQEILEVCRNLLDVSRIGEETGLAVGNAIRD